MSKQTDHSYKDDFISIYGKDSKDENVTSKDKINSLQSDGSASNNNSTTNNHLNIDDLQNLNDPNITPNILLEQLAYVDNFIPSLNQDFTNIDSWILNEENNEANGINSGPVNVFSGGNTDSFGMDEQLAVELSAFADESFIFPDEEKVQNNKNNNDGKHIGNSDEGESFPDGTENEKTDKKGHLLSLRRNNFLTSQYDNSRARFSKNKNKDTNHNENIHEYHNDEDDEDEEIVQQIAADPNDPDHGGFTNFDVSEDNRNQSNRILHQQRYNHAPSVSSPLTNIIATKPQIYSSEASPQSNQNTITDRSSTVGSVMAVPNIEMPDYSSIPTSTLIALLPRVKVPKSAYDSLIEAGFKNDQIDAISAIIAYHEQEKLKENPTTVMSPTKALASQLLPDDSSTRSAKFLMDLLSPVPPPPANKSPSPNSVPLKVSNTSLSAVTPVTPVTTSDYRNKQPKVKHKVVQKQEQESLFINSLIELGNKQLNEMKNEMQKTELAKKQKRKSETDIKTEFDRSLISSTSPSHSVPRTKSVESTISPLLENIKPQSSSQKSHQKRKLKEKELEHSIQDLSELAVSLQKRIHTLEMENKLLKDLVMSSGELEGIEKAENIKQNLLKKAHQSEHQV